MRGSTRNRTGGFVILVPWRLEHRGGVNQRVINLYKEIARAGSFDPLVLTPEWDSAQQEQENAGCRTVLMHIREPVSERASLRGLIAYFLTLPSTLYRLRRFIARYDIRVVDGQFPTLHLLNFAILKDLGLYRGKLFLSFQGRDIRNVAASRGMKRAFWHWLARRADALIFCSDGLASNLRGLDPRGRLKSVTVRNAISVEGLIREKRSAIAVQLPPNPFILNVAAFEHKKGQDILVRAFARLAPDFPEIDLVVLGQDGPVREAIKAMAAEIGLEERVHFLLDVPHPEVLAYLEKAMVFALPSRSEGLPIALLEAGVFGVPVVASRVDGIPEVINSEEVGILFDSEDDHGLEIALRKLLADHELRVSLGKRLQMRITAEFTWQKAWQEYLVLLNGAPAPNKKSLADRR